MTRIVKGIEPPANNGELHVRQDIDKWYADQVSSKGNRIQLTLFVEALARIQERPLEEELSYFRLAGIHAAPWCEWDGVKQPDRKAPDPDTMKGYCVHNNYTFPTWHRVYMMLYERVLFDAMHDWINYNVGEKHQPQWKREADAWRLPYWDFAREADRPVSTSSVANSDKAHDKLRLPILCMMPNVQILESPGKNTLKSRPNPMYKYVNSQLMGNLKDGYAIKKEDVRKVVNGKAVDPPEFSYPWDKCNATTKYGILEGFHEDIWADGGQNWLRANYALNEHPWYPLSPGTDAPVAVLQDLVYRLFQTGVENWGAFSSTHYKQENDTPHDDAKNAINLEYIHNNIHNWVGGTQFLRPPQQGINLWGSGHMSSVGVAAFDPIFYVYHNNIDRLTAMWQMLNWDLWFDDKHSKEVKNDDLLPFRKNQKGEFWKSGDVRNWRALGYDYPILKGLDCTKKGDRDKILKEIGNLYGAKTERLYDGLPLHDGYEDDFIITVVYDRYALGGAPYKINIFLEGAHNFRGPESEGFVASVYNFSGPLDESNCGNCERQNKDGVKCIAQVPATAPMRHRLEEIQKDPEKKDLQKRDVKKFLKENAPKPLYVALNGLGIPVEMGEKVQIQLHRSPRKFYLYPLEPNERDPLQYEFIKKGEEAKAALDDPAFPRLPSS